MVSTLWLLRRDLRHVLALLRKQEGIVMTSFRMEPCLIIHSTLVMTLPLQVAFNAIGHTRSLWWHATTGCQKCIWCTRLINLYPTPSISMGSLPMWKCYKWKLSILGRTRGRTHESFMIFLERHPVTVSKSNQAVLL